MGFITNARVERLAHDAAHARTAGRTVFAAKLNTPRTDAGFSGSVPDWAEMIEAVESAGWVLYHWSVAVDEKGRPEAYPLFRPRV